MEMVPLGDSAVIVRVGNSLAAVLSVLHKLEAANLGGVTDIAPAFASVAVFFDSPSQLESGWSEVERVLRRRNRRARATTKTRLVKVPVCYDAEFAPDLEIVARHSGLSPSDVGARHAAGRYHVRCVGFTPGFPFLGGLPEKLATPRREKPRTHVPAGAVGIGGGQTGIYPLASPGGWNIIGRTPVRVFDLTREPAALLRAGDRVRFEAISREEFEGWGR